MLLKDYTLALSPEMADYNKAWDMCQRIDKVLYFNEPFAHPTWAVLYMNNKLNPAVKKTIETWDDEVEKLMGHFLESDALKLAVSQSIYTRCILANKTIDGRVLEVFTKEKEPNVIKVLVANTSLSPYYHEYFVRLLRDLK
jgi:isopenicillin N synthase-like dioxygenase